MQASLQATVNPSDTATSYRCIPGRTLAVTRIHESKLRLKTTQWLRTSACVDPSRLEPVVARRDKTALPRLVTKDDLNIGITAQALYARAQGACWSGKRYMATGSRSSASPG